MKIPHALTSVAALALLAPAAHPQSFISYHGSSSPNSTWQFLDVSEDGSTAVGTGHGLGAIRWDAGIGISALPPLPGGYTSSIALSVSGDGTAICGSLNDISGAVTTGFHWSAASGYTVLRGLYVTPTFELTYPIACNGDGTLVGGYSSALATLDEITAWDLGVSRDPIAVPYPLGDETGFIHDFADTVNVGVGSSGPSGFADAHAIMWSPAVGTTLLVPPAGFTNAAAGSISGDGEVILGKAQRSGFGDVALVRWNRAGLSEVLAELPSTTFGASVTGTNHDGTAAVGYYFGTQSAGTVAFYWSEGTGLLDLADFLRSRGAPVRFSPWTHYPSGMSADGNVIVGSARRSTGNVTVGFIATLAPASPVAVGTDFCGPAVANSIGESPRLEAHGSPVAADDDMVFSVSGLPQRSYGFLIASQTQGSIPAFGGGLGTQCLGPSFSLINSRALVRLAGIFQRAAVRFDLQSVPFAGGTTALQAGETWNFQLWYRDQGATSPTSNLTSGRSITFQ